MLTAEKENAPLAGGATKQNGQYAGSVAVAQKIGNPVVDLSEARRLFNLGFKLCRLEHNSKQPHGKQWNKNPVANFDDDATGYGVMLAPNGLCSIDPDNEELSRKIVAGFGFDLEQLLDAGVRSESTRPGSGGRSVFRADTALRWIKFSFKDKGVVLELRATSANLQDAVPGLVYADKSGELRTQRYVNCKRLDAAPELPVEFLAWWRNLSTDLEFLREQQRRAGEIIGIEAQLAISGGGDGKQLAFKSSLRQSFNQANDVPEILLRHGYEQTVDGRFSPPTATGKPGIRLIPGKDDLYQSDHASDPLFGTFDAWSAFVVLDHEGDQDEAEAAWLSVLHQQEADEFSGDCDVSDLVGLPPAENLRFRLVPAWEFAQGKPPGWIIKGVIPRAELVVLFGESGSGKSFLALDMAAAIARGIDWRGNRTKAGRVVYIAAEGGEGFRNRLRAYELHHGVSLKTMSLQVIHATPNFLQKADALDIAKTILTIGKADVVIVDTFAQVIPGANENAAEDIGKALTHCRGIHRATGAVVVLVHHAGKDTSKGARGWSGLKAAADAEIEVLRFPVGRLVRVSKQKDGIDGREWGFDLHLVPVGMDEDGDVIDSCVVQAAEVPVTGKVGSINRRPLGKWERLVQEVVNEIALGQNSGIEIDHVLAEVMRRSPGVEEGKRDTRKQHARRALTALCEGDGAPYLIEGDCLSVLI